MIESIGGGWGQLIADRMNARDIEALEDYLACAWLPGMPPVYPARRQVFVALEKTSAADVRAVILGQDPYPTEGQACGLAFSVPEALPPGVGRPRSLGRILKELERERFTAPLGATLDRWTGESGVLLLNAALTYSPYHAGVSEVWRPFTAAVIQALVDQPKPIAFLLWGKRAQKWADVIV